MVTPPAIWKRYQYTLKVGDEVSVNDQLIQFVEMGDACVQK